MQIALQTSSWKTTSAKHLLAVENSENSEENIISTTFKNYKKFWNTLNQLFQMAEAYGFYFPFRSKFLSF